MCIRVSKTGVVVSALGGLLLLGFPQTGRAQVQRACYIPQVGAVYRIGEPGLPADCVEATHVEFRWEGSGSLDGVHEVVDGFALTGERGTGTIPIEGAGRRMMWYAGEAAFRAGTVSGDEWDAANVGAFSTAMGYGTTASGVASMAMGNGTTASGNASTAMGYWTTARGYASTAMGSSAASGDYSTAMGSGTASSTSSTAMGGGTTARGYASTAMGGATTASSDYSTAMGHLTTASGRSSTAMGSETIASGTASTAMGHRSVAGADHSFALGKQAIIDPSHIGTFLYADEGTFDFVSLAEDEFAVRAKGGVRFVSGTLADGTPRAGVVLTPGASSWSVLSDRSAKENFRNEDGEVVLDAIASMPIQSWNYKAQNATIRHIGPTAQDFYAAFELGEDELRINTIDIDGVNLLAIQALERRTRDLQEQLEAKDQEIEELRATMSALLRRLERLEGTR
jgi:hypothetical protein